MSTDQRIRIDLTPTQQQEIRTGIGRDVDCVEPRVERLEDRIAPSLFSACCNGQHIPEVTITA